MTVAAPPRWGKVIDHSLCIGCHACTTACRSENDVPLGVTRTYVKSVEVGAFPDVRRRYQVTRCNQCTDAPCVAICPTSAMHRRADGIVDFDKSSCIGCKACIAACPYDAIFINPDDHSAEKCNLCAHRLDVGLEPACVVVCPVEAIFVGDLDDPTSRVALAVGGLDVTVRKPEQRTAPKLFYVGGERAAIDPLAARRPDGGLYMWSEQGEGVGAGHPTSSAAALLSYDIPHRAPWDWRVSLYTWTKGVAAGAYLVAVLLAVLGALPWSGRIVGTTAPFVALVFLALTGAILIADLEHPARFPLLLLRPQWRSWLVRGALLIGGYGALLVVHLLGAARAAAFAGVPFALGTAVYTAFLFRQARARELWQHPLLPAALAVQSVLAGGAVLLLLGADRASGVLAIAVAAHLLLTLAEVRAGHGSEHARLAVAAMTAGSLAWAFRSGLLLVATGLAAPALGAWVAVPALAGLLLHEHAHVQAGQAVPLA